MVYRVSQDGWVIMKCADNKWSTRGRNGNQLQYSCLENIINSKKRKKDMTLQEETPDQKAFSMLIWGRVVGNYNSSREKKVAGPKQK